MLHVSAKDIEKLHSTLKGISKKSLPWAAREGLNESAFAARRQWEVEGRKSMIVRNKWTFGGRHHRVKKARFNKNIARMEAVTGSKLKYMAEQERGIVRHNLTGKGAPMPTVKSRVSRSKLRLQRTMYWRNRIKLMRGRPKRRKFSSQEAYVAASIARAKRRGIGFAYLDFGDKRGIYDVRTKTKTKLVWDLSKKVRRTKRNPMLKRTIKKLGPHMPIYHRSALERQLRRELKYRGFRVRGASMLSEAARFKSLG